MQDLTPLIKAAETARDRAYAPHSKFHVGACIASESGAWYAGGNVENACFALGTCAETNAIGQMIAAGDRSITCIVIVSSADMPCPPCGACRQRLLEFATADTPVHLCVAGKVAATYTLSELIPAAFTHATME